MLAPVSVPNRPSIEAVEVMHGPAPVADRKAVGGGDCGADEGLGVAHCCLEILAFGKTGRNR
jgi:hypothetical protein